MKKPKPNFWKDLNLGLSMRTINAIEGYGGYSRSPAEFVKHIRRKNPNKPIHIAFLEFPNFGVKSMGELWSALVSLKLLSKAERAAWETPKKEKRVTPKQIVSGIKRIEDLLADLQYSIDTDNLSLQDGRKPGTFLASLDGFESEVDITEKVERVLTMISDIDDAKHIRAWADYFARCAAKLSKAADYHENECRYCNPEEPKP